VNNSQSPVPETSKTSPDLPPTIDAGSETQAAPTSHSPASENTFGPSLDPTEIGTLGPYRILKELGRGGMGVVYVAVDTRLERQVALKVMLPQYASNISAKNRFLREARAAAKISHDNVVTIHEADEFNGIPYIAMQHLKGMPLDEYLKQNGSPSLQEIIRIGIETLSGLEAAHQLGLIHRDIKPGNLWLETPTDRVKVLDFGLAKPVDSEVELTKSGSIVGTPTYMSTEQARGEKLDPRADIYSVGVVLYRLCTGQLPFQGPNTMAVLLALATEQPKHLRALNPQVPLSLDKLIQQMLAKDANQRPKTALEAADRLRKIARELDTHTGSTQPPSQFTDRDSQTEIETNKPTPTQKSKKKTWVVIGIILLIIFGRGVIKNSSGNKKPPEETPKNNTPKKEIDNPVPKSKDPLEIERDAAEWIIQKGGGIVIKGNEDLLMKVKEIPKKPFTIEIIYFEDKHITDDDLIPLKELKGLKTLLFHGTLIKGHGLEHLKGNEGLTGFGLSDTLILNSGLVHLKHFKKIDSLNLAETGITDEGLAVLREMKTLRQLTVNKTGVTKKALLELQELIPECNIDYDGGTLPPKKQP